MDFWRLLTTWSLSGQVNMATDDAIAQQVAKGESPSTLRFYTWKPYTISLGYHQKVEEVNCQACKHDGIGLVRRPTGGRAVFHAEELTYAVIFDPKAPVYHPTILETYLLIARALVVGMRRLGVRVEVAPSRSSPNSSGSKTRFLCFSTTSAFEILAEGKKLIGSAQRRWPGVVLQHGSLLLGRSHLNLPHYLKIAAGEKTRWSKELQTRTICLEEILGQQPTPLHIAEAVQAGFEEIYNIHFHKGALSPQEQSEIACLQQKYQIPFESEPILSGDIR